MNENYLQVLLVEDCAADADLLLADLEQKGYTPLHQRVETREDFLAALQNRSWDVVIADYVLPHFSGPEALKLLRNRGFDTPFIMVSGVFGEEKAVTMIKAGANDYIMKGDLSRLVLAVERELKAAQDRRRSQRAESATLRYLAADVQHLQNFVEGALTSYGDGRARNDFNPDPAAAAPTGLPAVPAAAIAVDFPTLSELEKRHILAALDRCHGNRNNAAKLLDVSTRTLRNKLHEYYDGLPKSGGEKTMTE